MTETDHTTSLHQWIREIKTKILACGMDTVFYPYNATQPVQERDLFTDWATIKPEEVTQWVKDLQEGVHNDSNDHTKRAAVCEFDQDNLNWSFHMIKGSISLKFWRDIEPLLKGRTGPQLFMAVVMRKQYCSAGTARTLTEKMKVLQLTKEPGMDVTTFSAKILKYVE